MNRRQITQLLTLAGIVWLDRFPGPTFSEVSVADGSLRLDLVCMARRTTPLTYGLEIKSCAEDLRDGQLLSYTRFVDSLYVVAMPGVIPVMSAGRGIGLLELNPDWPLVGKKQLLEPRSVDNQDAWKDLLIVRKTADVEPASEKRRLDLVTGAAFAKRISKSWGAIQRRRHRLIEQLES